MAISDSNPERRNLVVAATAFIVYFAAGGHITDPTIRLSVINVSFDQPHVLAVIAWTMLLWFGLRFWQTSGSKYFGAFEQELRQAKVPAKLSAHAAALAQQRPKAKALIETRNATIEASSVHRQGNKWLVICHLIVMENNSRTQVREEHVEIKGWILRRHLARAFITLAVVNNAAADYLVPYILFGGAVLAPLWSKLL